MGDHVVVVDKQKWDTIVVSNNLIEYLNINTQWIQTPQWSPIKHPYGVIEQITIDRKSNFLLCISRYEDGGYKLHILNRKTLAEVESFEGIKEVVCINEKNDLTCIDIDGKMVSIDTNFDQFPTEYVETWTIARPQVTEIQNFAHEQLRATLQWGWLNIVALWDSVETGDPTQSNNIGDLIAQIWSIEIGWVGLKELFDTATTLDEIDVVSRAFDQIARNPAVAQVAGVTTPIEKAIREKRWNILVESLGAELAQIRANLGMMSDFSALIALQSELRDMRQRRSQISTVSPTLDEGIRDLTKLLDEKVSEYQRDHESEIYASVDTSLALVEKYLSGIDYMTGLTSVYTYDAWENAESQIGYLSPVKQDEYRDRMHTLVKARQGELQKLLDTEKLSEATKLKKKLTEIEWYIGQVEDIVGAVDNEISLSDMERTDPLVARIRVECELLGPSERDRLFLMLKSIFQDRSRDIRLARLDTRWVTHTLDEYGLDTGLYHSERGHQAISYTVWGKRTSSGMIRLELRIANGANHVYDFDTYLSDPSAFTWVLRWKMAGGIAPEMTQVDFVELQSQIAGWRQGGKVKLQKLQSDLSQAYTDGDLERQKDILKETQALKIRYQKARFTDRLIDGITREKQINPRPYLQKINDKFIVLDEEKELIKKLSDGMMIQKETGKGIDILEWPPGLGKTEICRFIAGISNREIIRIQCAKMDPSDMFFSPQLKAGETTRQPAEWIALMQKPGVIVLFDEIDKLSSECFDRLHSLFDGGRSVFDPQVGSFKAHRDTVFLATRNSYEKMTNPIVSRGTITLMKAPGEENEAFKVLQYTGLPYFEKMDYVEFKRQYKLYAGGTKSTDPNEKVVASVFGNIRWLVQTLNDLRAKQKSENFDDKFEYELSYRDAEQIFLRYNRNPGSSFKEKVQDVLIPKVRAVVLSFEDKDSQEKIAQWVLNTHFF